MNEKISVIIPVYQTERYLKQCVDSVLKQSYHKLEILLVDDGSTDQSPKLCDAYEKQDQRVKVIHQKNGGLSNARNSGIKAATGKYIVFLDSDDYWDDETLIEKLVTQAKKINCDVVNFRYKFFIESTGAYQDCLPSVTLDSKVKDNEEIVQYLLENGLYLASACNKMIRAELLKSNKLFFREGITSEDVDWCARILLKANTMGYCDTDAYVYRQREGSITHTVKYKNVVQLADNVKYCINLGEVLQPKSRMYQIYYTYVAYQYGVFLTSNHYAKDKRVKALRKEMKQYCWLLEYRSNPKVRKLYLLNKYIGFYGMNFVMKIYSKIR